MAFGSRRNEDAPTTTAAAATPSTNASGGLTAFIDQGSSFEGKLSFKDTVRIDGHFSGEITSENTLVVGESGDIQAQIRSKTVIISGTVVGDIHASQRVVLHKSAQVEGNIESPSMAIEEGAVFHGHVSMKGAERKASAPLKAVGGGEAKKSEAQAQVQASS